jgi:prepilin-type N-terminal cleavage/methylation domain-containing protein
MSFQKRQQHNNKGGTQDGFTLVETLAVIALFTILSGVLLNTIVSFYHFNAYTIAEAYQVDNARKGVEALVHDAREMTYADDGSFPLVTMKDNKMGFYSDIDGDGSAEYVEYELNGTTLKRRIYNATGTPPVYDTGTPDETDSLSEYVQNDAQNVPAFVYYDNNGDLATSTTTVTDIRYVGVQVIVNIDPIRDPGQYMLRSSAALRNIINTYD